MARKDDEHESEWTKGLPSKADITPLSHPLISRMLANSFRIKHDEPMTEEDVRRESKSTLHNIFKQKTSPSFDPFPAYQEQEGGYGYGVEGRRVEQEGRANRTEEDSFRRGLRAENRVHTVEDRMDYSGAFRAEIPRQPCTSGNEKAGVKSFNAGAQLQASPAGREYRTTDMDTEEADIPVRTTPLPYGLYQARSEGNRRNEDPRSEGAAAEFELDDVNSAGGPMSSNNDEDPNSKRPARIVWTPQLHKRFVEAVGHLGIKNAVPKTIMQLMNVEGLTRENVASHLQKYRLHLKRMQAGHSNDVGPSPSDHLFSSTPLPPGIMPSHYIQQDGGASAYNTPIMPMPYQGLVRPGPFGGYEHMPYGQAVAGRYMPMPDPRMAIPEPSGSQTQRNSQNLPTDRVLPLFPTNQG